MIVASVSPRSYPLSSALAAAALIGAALLPTPASAVTGAVRAACAGDYFTHCSSFSPGSAETRRCMRAVGARLSRGCISALVAAGEVSKSEVARHQQASKH